MLQMAGIVKRHAQVQGMARGARLETRQDFADVLALRRKASRAAGVFRIVTEQVTVFFHIGAASGGVGDNDLDFSLLECINRFFSQSDCAGFFSGVNQQCAATLLCLWRNHFATFRRENANGSGIHRREKLALHAAEEQAHATAFYADGRSDFKNFFLRLQFGKQRFHGLPFLWKQLEQAQATDKHLQAGFLVGEKRVTQAMEAIRLRERLKQEMAMALLTW